MFNVGDRVVCLDGFVEGYTGKFGEVVFTKPAELRKGETVVGVRFDGEERIKEWYSFRFELTEFAGISPICIKIRLMEKRWQEFQERKKNAMA